ncbi:MAG TPA: DUF2306 domain-containing protein [Casimicrobiaceae bacterium]|nr:DUF2306 domain-containing protein [Casimicrobiaceae bacterium]
MSTVPFPRPGSARLPRPKYIVFALIALMLAYVLVHNEAFLVDRSHPAWQHYATIGGSLLPHAIAGAIALFLGVAQFSARVRGRRIGVHRILGRIYVGAVAVAAPLGVLTQYLDQLGGDPPSFTIAAAVDAALWLLATGIAFWCIRNKRIDQHRQWMTRSFAVALVFLEVRVIVGVTGWERLGVTAVETVVWCCVAAAYPLADLVLLLEERLRARQSERARARSALAADAAAGASNS